MARIRTLKPEFWQDEKLSPLPPLERLVFLGLLSMADDAGRLVDNVKLIDGMIFPNTDDSSRDAIETLARLGRVCRYTAASGQKCIQIVGWSKHQKVDNPAKHVLPEPTPKDLERPAVTESSRESRESDARSSRSDLGPRIMDLGPSTTDQGSTRGRKRTAMPAFPGAVCSALHSAWITHVGGVELSFFRKSLSPLYPTDSPPLYSEAEMAAAIQVFGETRDAQPVDKQSYWHPKKFASEVHNWVRLSRQKVQNDDGTFTERGRLAMGAVA